MNEKDSMELGSAPVGPLLWKLALPAILSQLVNVLYNMVDRMYIGHIPGEGTLALAGLGVAFPILMIVSAFAALMGYGAASRASIALGEGKKERAELFLGNSTTLLFGTGLLLMILLLLGHNPLLRLFGASDTTLPYAAAYLRIYALGTVFVELTLGLNAFITAQGFSQESMKVVLWGAGSNILLDPILIYGLKMGVRGAAWATILSQGLSAFLVLRFLLGKKTVLDLKKKNLSLQKDIVLPSVSLGVSPFVMLSTEGLLNLVFNSSLLRYGGDLAVGAITISSSLMQFGLLPLSGLTQGGQPILSYNYGARKPERVQKTFRLLLGSSLGFSLLLWSLYELFPTLFIRIFTKDPALTALTVPALRVYVAALGLFGAQIACQQSFIAFGNAGVSAFLALFRKLILLIPLILILPHFMKDPVFAVFLAEPVADLIAVGTTLVLFRKSFQKLLQTIQKPAEF